MIKPIFIAEIKTQSPFGFKSEYSFSQLAKLAIQNGDWISVHTNALWGGDFNSISYVRTLTNKTILAKGFHHTYRDIINAFEHGADYVLTLNSNILDFFADPYFEGYNIYNLLRQNINKIILEVDYPEFLRITKRYDKHFLRKVKLVYNGRDLNTGIGKKSIHTYHEYRQVTDWICGASLIKSPNDVQIFYPNCNAFIVGEELVKFCKELNK